MMQHHLYWICCMYALVVADAGYMTRSLSNLMDSIRSVYYENYETTSLSILEFGNQHFHNYQVEGRYRFLCLNVYHRFMSVIY